MVPYHSRIYNPFYAFFSINLHLTTYESLLNLENLLEICLLPRLKGVKFLNLHMEVCCPVGQNLPKEVVPPSQYSKLYVLVSATNATSNAIDFSKGNVNNGVVDSPFGRKPIISASPLQSSLCISH